MTNDNQKTPKQIMVPDRKIVDLQGKPVQAQETPITNIVPDKSGPPTRNFMFTKTDGTTIKGTGFLVATASFIGLAVGEGEIIIIVPMTQLADVSVQDDTLETLTDVGSA